MSLEGIIREGAFLVSWRIDLGPARWNYFGTKWKYYA